MEYKGIGQNIRSIRKKKNLTQKEISERLNMSQTAFRKFENDMSSPRLDTIYKLANALEVKVTDLIVSPDQHCLEEIELIDCFNKLNSEGKQIAKNITEVLAANELLRK